MKYKCPRRRRVDESLLFVNKNDCQNCQDTVDLSDLADYIGLADPESIASFLESRHINVRDGRRHYA